MSPDKTTLDELRIDRGAAPSGRARGWVALLIVLLLVAGGGVFWWINRPKATAVRTIAVREVSSGGQKTLLNASGYVTARRIATVSSKVSGKVMEVLVEEGMKVEAGQVLARLDSSNVEKSLRLSEAQFESTRRALGETQANLEQAEREFRRAVQLTAEKISTQSELERAEAGGGRRSGRARSGRLEAAT